MVEYKNASDLIISVRDNEIVREYMLLIQRGIPIDPVKVKGARVKDGNHRAAAFKLLGMEVPCETLR